MKKLALTLLLLCTVLLAFPAMAETTIEVADATALQNALATWTDGDTIKLTGDITCANGIDLTTAGTYTINLDGHTLTVNGNVTVGVGVTLSLQGPNNPNAGTLAVSGTDTVLDVRGELTAASDKIKVQGKVKLTGTLNGGRYTLVSCGQGATFIKDKPLEIENLELNDINPDVIKINLTHIAVKTAIVKSKTDLKNALEGLGSSGLQFWPKTVQLGADITCDEAVSAPRDDIKTIDLNGYNLTLNNTLTMRRENVDCYPTITDNSGKATLGKVTGSGGIKIVGWAQLTVGNNMEIACKVTVSSGCYLSGGNYTGEVINQGTINGTTHIALLDNQGTISGDNVKVDAQWVKDASALNAILQQKDGPTAKLANDITTSSELRLYGDIGKSTIDLAGKVLALEWFYCERTELTITDSVGGGKVAGGGLSLDNATLCVEKDVEIACDVTSNGTIKGGHYTGDTTCAAASTLTGDATHKTRISLLKSLPTTLSGDVTIDMLLVDSYDAFNKAVDSGCVAAVKLEGTLDDQGNLRSSYTIGRDFTINMDGFNTKGSTNRFLLHRSALTVVSGKTLTISNSTDDYKPFSGSIDVARDAKLVLDGYLHIQENVSFDISVTDVNTALTRKPYTNNTTYPFFNELTVKNQGQMDFALSTDAYDIYLAPSGDTFTYSGDLTINYDNGGKEIFLNGHNLTVDGNVVANKTSSHNSPYMLFFFSDTTCTITADKIIGTGSDCELHFDPVITVDAEVEATTVDHIMIEGMNGNSNAASTFLKKVTIGNSSPASYSWISGHFKELHFVGERLSANKAAVETMVIQSASGLAGALGMSTPPDLLRLDADLSLDSDKLGATSTLSSLLDLNGHTISGTTKALELAASSDTATILKDSQGAGAITAPLTITKGKVDSSALATVTFNPGYAKDSMNDKGNYPDSQAIVRGQKATRPADPLAQFDASAGTMALEGWRKQGEAALFSFDTIIMADTTLEAQWQSCVLVGSSDELKAALASGTSKTIVLTKDFPLTEDLTTSADASISMAQGNLTQSGHTLTVAPSHTLSLNAGEETKLPLVVRGRLKAAAGGAFTTSEDVTVENGGTIESGTYNGHVTVKEGGVIEGGIFYGEVTNNGTIMDSACAFITLDTDGGESMDPVRVLRGQKPIEPADAVKTGHNFVGWFKDESEYAFDTPLLDDLTLKAHWTPKKYTVTVDHGFDDIKNTVTYNYGSIINVPGAIIRDGYTFVGWFKDDALYDFTAPLTSDITLLAHWKLIDEQLGLTLGSTYYFDLSALSIPGTVSNAQFVPFTFMGTVTAYKLTAPGCITADAAANASYAHSLFMANDNLTTNVSWNQLKNAGLIFGKEYTFASISYDLRLPSVAILGAGEPYSEWTGMNNKSKTLLPSLGTGYSWGQDNDVMDEYILYQPASRLAYYAEADTADDQIGYRPVLEVPTTLQASDVMAVTLDLNGSTLGGKSSLQIVAKASGYTAPDAASLTAPADKFFEGWTGTDGEFYAAGDTVLGTNAKLTAKWQDTHHTVTFDVDGTTTTATVLHGKTVDMPTDPQKEGFTFAGWYNGDAAFDFATPITADTTLTAKWTENTYTITFDVDGATTTATVLHGRTVARPDDPTKTGFLFMGWYVGTEEFDFTTPIIADVTLTAKWQEADAPTISGLLDGKTYCGPVTFSVKANIMARAIDDVSVTVNGEALEADARGTYTLQPANGAQKVVATNQAGKTTEATVTVNDGHTWGDWTSNGDGTHTHTCSINGCAETEKADCIGGKATCTEKPLCDQCGSPYATPDAHAHPRLTHVPAKASTTTEIGNIEYWHCEQCDKYYADAAATKEISKADTILPLQPEVPKTGDSTPLSMWICLLLLCMGGLAIMRKRIHN